MGVHDLFASALAVQAAGVAGDAEGLGGAGDVDPGGGHDLDEAVLGAPVAAPAAAGAARPPGAHLRCDGGGQAGLVAFHGQHVAGAGGVEQGGGGVLGVQRVL